MKLTKKICFIACFSALFIVLDNVSILIPVVNLNISFRNLPLYIGAYLYGPYVGMLIGFLGTLVSQMKWSLNLMSIIWMIPQISIAALLGMLAYKKIIDFDDKHKKNVIYIVLINLILTVLNTIVSFIDGLYYGGNVNAVFISVMVGFPLRVVSSIVTGIVYATVMPYIIRLIKNIK